MTNHITVESIYGYLAKDSEIDRALKEALGTRTPITATLKISFPPDSERDRMVIIDEFVKEIDLQVAGKMQIAQIYDR